MKKKDLERFRKLLLQEKEQLIEMAEKSYNEEIQFSPDDLADEVDLASAETDKGVMIRLRDRERMKVKKIEKALAKIDDGSFGVCEKCQEEIEVKRLEARPVTDLCIRCKEEQEKIEKSYASRGA